MATTVLVGLTQVPRPVPAAVEIYFTDTAYLRNAIVTSWTAAGNRTQIQETDILYWIGKARIPYNFGDGFTRVGWNKYWEARTSPTNDGDEFGTVNTANIVLAGKEGILGRNEEFVWDKEAAGARTGIIVRHAVPLNEIAAKGIMPQLGLLEDDILYNLSLLCENVLMPLKAAYPNIVIVSGFRQVNNGISQHERGEAVDIRLANQTPELLYEVADYVAKNLQFDQMVLNYAAGNLLPWLHISFTSKTLRREVVTRDFDDTFHDGLFLITELTGEARAAAQREQDDYLGQIDAELATIKARDEKLNAPTIIADEILATGAEGLDEDEDGGPPGLVGPSRLDIVSAVIGSRNWNFVDEGISEEDNRAACGQFVEALVSALRSLDPQWGLLKKSGGQRQYEGHGVDVVAYRGIPGDPDALQANGKAVTPVDVLIASKSDTPKASWSVLAPGYNIEDWLG
jgi:hypothetical protein